MCLSWLWLLGGGQHHVKWSKYVALMPSQPGIMDLLMENSPRYLPIISGYISIWLKILLLYLPTMRPTISERMIISHSWVFITAGFFMNGTSFALNTRLSSKYCFCHNCMSVHQMHVFPSEARISWKWNDKSLWAVMLVLGIEPRSSGRSECVLNC